MAASPSRAEVLSLFISLLRTARQFSDYNIREYAKRRTIDGFRDNSGLSDLSSITAAFAEGKSQLEVMKRQVFGAFKGHSGNVRGTNSRKLYLNILHSTHVIREKTNDLRVERKTKQISVNCITVPGG